MAKEKVKKEEAVALDSLAQPDAIVEPAVPTSEQVIESTVTDEAIATTENVPSEEQVEDIKVETNEVKTSGTTTEEELVIDATKARSEVLDEFEIKMDVINEEKRYKKNLTFIIIVLLLIVAFIFLMPLIVKKIGF